MSIVGTFVRRAQNCPRCETGIDHCPGTMQVFGSLKIKINQVTQIRIYG